MGEPPLIHTIREVELDNEPDVLVDANSGEIIGTDDDEEEDE